MKNKLRISTTILITCMFIMLSSMTSFAVTPSDAKDNSVVVVATYDSNGQAIGWGSGFAIGEPGKAIQYIVTSLSLIRTS